jgi:hypothetical protein
MLEVILASLLGVFCLWGARYWVRLRRRVNAWPVVRGRITERKAVEQTNRGAMKPPGYRWSPEARFVYRVGDADYAGDKIWLPWSWLSSQKRAEAFLATIPDEVDVRYDPADPKTSCLYAPPFSNVLWYGITGAVLFGFGLLWLLVQLLSML